MKWEDSHKSGLCYSNVSLIKRSLFQSKTGKLPYPEILHYVNDHWNKDNSTKDNDIKQLVDLALYAPKSFFEENENGLWEIKSQIDETLTPIINYVKRIKRPFQLRELVRKFRVYNNERDLREFVLRDIRFTELEGTAYWLLSEWELINDHVYKYMQKRSIESAVINEIFEIVIKKYNLNEDMSIFFPEVDKRFSIKENTVWIELNQEQNIPKEILVTDNIREELARNSIKILEWVNEQKGEFKIKDCLVTNLSINVIDRSFPVYYQALEDFFNNIPSLIKVQKGRWIHIQDAPSLNIENTSNINYSILNSKPVIRNIEELVEYSQLAIDVEEEKNNNDENTKKVSLPYSYTTVSYYERVKGYLALSSSLTEFLGLENQALRKITINVENYNYDCWISIKDGRVYCYGNGIFDFYADYLIEPGSKLKISVDHSQTLTIQLLGVDERYALEQQRFLDIGRLANESKKVNKSIFTIMCEVMATYPSGIHWTILLDKVNEIRLTTKNTVTHLLSKNECFVNLPDKKGYWRLNITKLSGYYIDENNHGVINYIYPEEEKRNTNQLYREEAVIQLDEIKVINQEKEVEQGQGQGSQNKVIELTGSNDLEQIQEDKNEIPNTSTLISTQKRDENTGINNLSDVHEDDISNLEKDHSVINTDIRTVIESDEKIGLSNDQVENDLDTEKDNFNGVNGDFNNQQNTSKKENDRFALMTTGTANSLIEQKSNLIKTVNNLSIEEEFQFKAKIQKMEVHIRDLEELIKIQEVENKTYRKKISIILGMTTGILMVKILLDLF